LLFQQSSFFIFSSTASLSFRSFSRAMLSIISLSLANWSVIAFVRARRLAVFFSRSALCFASSALLNSSSVNSRFVSSSCTIDFVSSFCASVKEGGCVWVCMFLLFYLLLGSLFAATSLCSVVPAMRVLRYTHQLHLVLPIPSPCLAGFPARSYSVMGMCTWCHICFY